MSYSYSMPFGDYSYRPLYTPTYNTVPQSVSYPAPTANCSQSTSNGDTFASAMSGAPMMAAFQYGGVLYNAVRHPHIAQAAWKQTESIVSGVRNFKTMTDAQKAITYERTYRNVSRAMRAGKSSEFVTSFGTHTANRAAGAFASSATATSKITAGGLWRGFKAGGGPLMFGVEMLCEAPEMYTAFSQGGFSEGVKQTAKSAVKAGASAGGWVGGAALGGKAGAAIGTAICPGIGTAIGAAIGGIIGGIGGSWLGRKTAKAVTGKDFTEKMAAQQQMQPQFAGNPQAGGASCGGNPQGGNGDIDLSGLNFNSPNPYLARLIAYKQAMAA